MFRISHASSSFPGIRKFLRVSGWFLLVLLVAFSAFSLVVRYLLWPEIPNHKARIEAAASEALGLPVRVGEMEARWFGLNPALTLKDIRIENPAASPENKTALTLERVEGVLSWRSVFSVWRGEPRFALLALDHPDLQIRRDAFGNFFVASIPVAFGTEHKGTGLLWLLTQSRIRISNARIVWRDDLRNAPPLTLENVRFELRNQGSHHRFGLFVQPPPSLADQIDLRGDLRGHADDPPEDWRGTLYGRLDRLNLSGLRDWMDDPARISEGTGGLRFWLTRENSQWKGTTDLALQNPRLRLKPDLPELDLARLAGRLSFNRSSQGFRVTTRQLSLETRDGSVLEPLDLVVNWQNGAPPDTRKGSLTANILNLRAVSKLAAHLPLNPEIHALLKRHQPQGVARQLDARWEVQDGLWKTYRLSARFSHLGLNAAGNIPGLKGLSGGIRMDERGGSLTLDSRDAALSFPAVFAESETPLTRLQTEVVWKTPQSSEDKALEPFSLQIRRFDFQSPHAEGALSGHYRSAPQGPGVIDLEGNLSRAQATAVWRYLPKVVHENVSDWLRKALVAGEADNVRLVLKGDLSRFPFRDPRDGTFRVTARARDVTLRYVPGWPEITRLEADLSFGSGMEIKEARGTVSGARIQNAVVAITDFAAPEPQLTVHGKAAGDSANFLDFIRNSPVVESIGHFLGDMRAQGNGALTLGLEIPLHEPEKTLVAGDYSAERNLVHFIPEMPPASDVSGNLSFTRETLTIPELVGEFLGQPIRLTGTTEQDATRLKLNGGLRVAALRQFLGDASPVPAPLLDALSGQTEWQAEIALGKQTDFTIASTLRGLSVRLPPPFAKTAGEARPLTFRKTTPQSRNAASRERFDLSISPEIRGELWRRQEGERQIVERGVLSVGNIPRTLPEQGLNLFVAQDSLNLDDWRPLAAALNQSPNAGPALPLPIRRVTLEARKLTILGHAFDHAVLNLLPATPAERDQGNPRWRVMVASKEALGEIFWENGGKGRLTASLERLHLPQEDNPESSETPISDLPSSGVPLQELPDMDVSVADFRVGALALGRLELRADNLDHRWNLRRIDLKNPDAHLNGSGTWENTPGQGHTRLDFTLDANNAGKLLDRLGYADMARGGTAQLSGELGWEGSPAQFDPNAVTGALRLEAANGQFSRLEPGVGKLLGLLSLSSISRRLSLDFRDIFNQGFAFDRLTANLTLKDGLLKTEDDLKINGPAGEVTMRGVVNLQTETQDLHVVVTPEIGGVAAIGTAVAINPAVGVAALIAQNLLKNPLNKVFRLQYHVTGHWHDPVVERMDAASEHNPSP